MSNRTQLIDLGFLKIDYDKEKKYIIMDCDKKAFDVYAVHSGVFDYLRGLDAEIDFFNEEKTSLNITDVYDVKSGTERTRGVFKCIKTPLPLRTEKEQYYWDSIQKF